MNENEIDTLWQQYSKTRDIDVKNELITHYLYVVEKVVRRMMPVYGQHIEYDDMIGYGVLGLIDAIDKFEPDKNVKFDTYSQLRVKGEIIDSIRKLDWAPVSLRSKIKQINKAYDELASEGVLMANEEDVAQRVGMEAEQVRKIQTSNSMFNVVSLEEILYKASLDGSTPLGIRDTAAQPGAALEAKERTELLAAAIAELSEKEQLVIQLYYYEEFMIKDIAKILKVSESRASQIHSKALETLCKKLKEIYQY